MEVKTCSNCDTENYLNNFDKKYAECKDCNT